MKNKTTEQTQEVYAKEKKDYASPVAQVEIYKVERGFASSGAFESLGENGTSYGNGDFT
ncbi:MAG: hypothetical protein IJU81_05675 [Bacteroidales bacterium]|nr:hypothetical protein [Bacteroidales bacterium]